MMRIDPLDSAASGATVLTANKRLARELVRRYDQRQVAAGGVVWASPAILTLDAWIMRQAQGLGLTATVLTDAQCQHLWEEIIGADLAACGRDLLQIPQAARRAYEAHALLTAYLAEVPVAEADEDHLAFLRWRTRWHERLQRNRWLERGELVPTVVAALAAGRSQAPGHVVLAGFDDLTPMVNRLCEVLRTQGCRIEQSQPPQAESAVLTVHGALDMADEVRSCARWARLRLERDLRAKVGVVVPRLGEYQGLIERIFRAELDPAACLIFGDAPDAFALSLGTPLIREGVVHAALRILSVGDPLRLDEIGWLLRTPYLGGSELEGPARARADRTLRERGRGDWSLTGLGRALAGVPCMVANLTRLREISRDGRRRLPGEWAENFAGLLDGCGWPGERGLSSREFQAIDHFRGSLGQLATLDRVAQPMKRGEALAVLKRLAGETVFQPEGSEGRIQVLGMLEAAGFSFDALWIMGLHEGAFPPPPRPNPFLPLSVQSRLRMPHADAAREREFAERLAHRLFRAAPDVVASWPGQLDGAPLRPSPLLAGATAAPPDLAPSCDPFRLLLAAPCPFEEIVDQRAVPLPAGQLFSGGTTILKDQALCPFRAFAHHRLHAERLEAPDLGLDNMARGNLVHGVLERFWRQVVNQTALLELTSRRQAELLTVAAEEALSQYERRSRCDLPPRLRALEGHRLVATAAGWLELERQRSPFQVAEIEQRHDVEVGRLRLRTRIDRLDELPNGQVAVIDYKTGRPSARQWLDHRVTEPQLPLYCLGLDDARIAAVLFAMVRARGRECSFKGVAREPAAWPKLSTSSQERLFAERGWSHFDELLGHWRTALPALGDAFVDSWAAVDPVDPQQACKFCDLATLCRIVGTADAAEADHGEEGADD